MFDNRVIAEFKKVVGWDNHFDLVEIPTLPTSLTDTESGLHYQTFFPSLVRLDYIAAMLPTNYGLEAFLDKVETDSINEMLLAVSDKKKLANIGKELVSSNIILQNSIRGTNVTNEGRFVGIEFALSQTEGIRVVINRIGLYLTAVQPTLTLYLFNSLQDTAVSTYTYTSASSNSFQWVEEAIMMDYNSGSGTDNGVWYLGYYQDDLVGQAVQYSSLNWKNGYCGTCNGGAMGKTYGTIKKYVSMQPFYIAPNSLPAVGTLFSPNDVVYTYTNNYGFNINLSVKCDLSQFWIDNRLSFKNAIGKSVVFKVLQMFIGSSQVSAVEQNLQVLALRAVEGANDSKQEPYYKQVERAIEVINLDQGNINESPCLPCARRGSSIGAL